MISSLIKFSSQNFSIRLPLFFTSSEHSVRLISCPVVLIVLIGTYLDEPYWIVPAKHTAGSSIQTALTLVSLKWTRGKSRGGFLKYRWYKCTSFWYVRTTCASWKANRLIFPCDNQLLSKKVPILCSSDFTRTTFFVFTLFVNSIGKLCFRHSAERLCFVTQYVRSTGYSINVVHGLEIAIAKVFHRIKLVKNDPFY